MQAGLAHRAEEQSAHRAETAGADDEQVGSVGGVQQGGGRQVVDDDLLDRGGGSRPDRGGNDRLERRDGVGFAVGGVEWRADGGVVLVEEPPGEHRGQRPVAHLGLAHRPAQRVCGAGGLVDTDNDAAHFRLLTTRNARYG